MNKKEALEVLKDFALWRRADDEDIKMPDPKLIGQALDFVIKELEK